MSRGMEKSLWDIAIDQQSNHPKAAPSDETQVSEDASVVIFGSRNAGKTSIILRFVDSDLVTREEAPKPTVALEYTFGRRSKGHNIAKDVGHIWELGGGTWLSKLLDIPINVDTILHTTLILVLDLSKPNELWTTMEALLKAAQARIEAVIAEARDTQPNLREILKERAWERVGEDHMDKNMIDPFLMPLVIIGAKNDVFQDMDSEQRKVICKTLRFVAHSYGATLQFFSTKNEQLIARMKSLTSHFLFSTPASKTLQTDHNKPLLVPVGTDSFQQIGSPPISDKDLGRISAKTPMDLWRVAFAGYFPQESSSKTIGDDPGKDSHYVEPAIDQLRSQKDEELERYRKMAEKRAKDNKSQDIMVLTHQSPRATELIYG